MECDPIQFEPVSRIAGNDGTGLLLLCDHATNALPVDYGDLGLPATEFERHIAYDIGTEALVRGLAEELAVPALLSGFSRLLIDPNRGEDDPTLIMRISDGAIVPGNAGVDAQERERRLKLYYRPYHDAISGAINRFLASDIVPVILSVHSFTPVWRDQERPWHAGILWDMDPRIARPLIAELSRQEGLIVGDNEPYTGQLRNDTLYKHGTLRGLAHALIEVRQDLIATPDGVGEWVGLLAQTIDRLLDDPGLREITHFGTVTPGR